jgi:hypothetical protein
MELLEKLYHVLGIIETSFVLGHYTSIEIYDNLEDTIVREKTLNMLYPHKKTGIISNLSKEQLINFQSSQEELGAFQKMILKAEKIALKNNQF